MRMSSSASDSSEEPTDSSTEGQQTGKAPGGSDAMATPDDELMLDFSPEDSIAAEAEAEAEADGGLDATATSDDDFVLDFSPEDSVAAEADFAPDEFFHDDVDVNAPDKASELHDIFPSEPGHGQGPVAVEVPSEGRPRSHRVTSEHMGSEKDAPAPARAPFGLGGGGGGGLSFLNNLFSGRGHRTSLTPKSGEALESARRQRLVRASATTIEAKQRLLASLDQFGTRFPTAKTTFSREDGTFDASKFHDALTGGLLSREMAKWAAGVNKQMGRLGNAMKAELDCVQGLHQSGADVESELGAVEKNHNTIFDELKEHPLSDAFKEKMKNLREVTEKVVALIKSFFTQSAELSN